MSDRLEVILDELIYQLTGRRVLLVTHHQGAEQPFEEANRTKQALQSYIDTKIIEEHNLVFTKTGELNEAELAFWSAERLKELGVEND